MFDRKNSSKFIFGILLIVIGILWILNNIGYISIEIPDYIFSWQSILILIGLIILINNKDKFGGLLLIAIGTYFLLPDIFPEFTYKKMWEFFIPFLLILFGLSLIFKRNKNKNFTNLNENNLSEEKTDKDDFINSNNERVEYSTVLSESNRKFFSNNFTGGKVTVVMGSSILDLSSCTFSNQNNILNISIVMGQLTLIMPADSNAIIDVQTIMGEIEDLRSNKNLENKIDKILTIKGNITMGSLKILG